MSGLFSSLPVEIPNAIKALARPLTGPDEGLLAWSRLGAWELLKSLTRSRVGISRGEVYRGSMSALIPLDDWECHRVGAEQPAVFAERSRAVATAYVNKYGDDLTGPVLFVFDFDTQRAAA
jgi:hypothetical protein